jgi:hypothetical protein
MGMHIYTTEIEKKGNLRETFQSKPIRFEFPSGSCQTPLPAIQPLNDMMSFLQGFILCDVLTFHLDAFTQSSLSSAKD